MTNKSPPRSPKSKSRTRTTTPTTTGTILEAAFVDPAYQWPPPDGVGKNAIELQASMQLLMNAEPKSEDDEESIEPPRIRNKSKVITETEIVTTSRCGFLRLCQKEEPAVVHTHTERYPVDDEEKARLQEEYISKKKNQRKLKKEKSKKAREDLRQKMQKEKYARIPEGIFVYRLDTAAQTITLLSNPSANTNLQTLIKKMTVSDAYPSKDKSRRGIWLLGNRGEQLELISCGQRTAIAWMEALRMMLGKREESSEDQYLNLAAYSNNLIHTGAIESYKPTDSTKQSSSKNTNFGSTIYYSVTKTQEPDIAPGDEIPTEALESIAKRRAVIKDSWDFYRLICSLLRDRRKYDETFRRMQLDSVYPYLNSMTGLNDPGDDAHGGGGRECALVMQKDEKRYKHMSRTQVCRDLVEKAEAALPSLVEICKALAGSLGMEEVGVGPIKEASIAIRKAEKKYEGDVLKVTDFCRSLLVVKDFPTLLALLELARDSFGPLIRRVKLSTLKNDHESLPGGYRDCKINVELKGHICEIQIHVWPMWVVCGVEGFRHYRHCLEYNTDSFQDPYDALANLDDKTLAELIVMAEEAVAGMPLDNLEWYHEKFILDYFAEVGLFLDHGLSVWAETTLCTLIKLRCESPDIGADHQETLYLQKYLEKALRMQNKMEEADAISERLKSIETMRRAEKEEVSKSLWDTLLSDPSEALNIIMDPSKKERDEEIRLKKEVKASKKVWRTIREQRFKRLDTNDFSESASHRD